MKTKISAESFTLMNLFFERKNNHSQISVCTVIFKIDFKDVFSSYRGSYSGNDKMLSTGQSLRFLERFGEN